MSNQPDPTPAALYARVSSDRQDVDLSVAAQLRALRNYAAQHGYVVAREYVDEAESGRIAARPQFRRMLDETSRSTAPFEVILVWKFSRFTRKREHAVAFKALLRRRGVKVVSITEHADDSPTGKLMEAIIESVDEFYSENLAQEVTRGMREAAARGFWMASRAPYGYTRVLVPDGAKERPKLAVVEPAAGVVRRLFTLADRGQSLLDITKTLNAEGVASPTGQRWLKTTVQKVLTNEVYTGTLVWGANAKDQTPPVRVADAFPALVSAAQFRRVAALLASRGPAKAHPRRSASSYLLSGLVKCRRCGRALTGQAAKRGQFAYYVCQSLLHRGSGACDAPRLNARRFEGLIVEHIRDSILTAGNIRSLVRLVHEELDGVAQEQRRKLAGLETELAEVRRRLDRVWQVIETSDLDLADATERIKAHRARQERLERAAAETRALLSDRRAVVDDVAAIMAYARDRQVFLQASERAESRAFIQSFVQEIAVAPGAATIRYALPLPEDGRIPDGDTAAEALKAPVPPTVPSGGPDWTKSRTGAASLVPASAGMGTVYVSVAASSTTSIPCTKLRSSAFRSGNVPRCNKARKSATYPVISAVPGNATLRWASWCSAASRAAASWSCRCRSARMRGDSAARVRALVSNAS